MTPEQKEAQARSRFYMIQLARILGIASVVFGMMILAGRFESIPKIAGYVLMLNGLVDILFVPRFLARRWRTPPEA